MERTANRDTRPECGLTGPAGSVTAPLLRTALIVPGPAPARPDVVPRARKHTTAPLCAPPDSRPGVPTARARRRVEPWTRTGPRAPCMRCSEVLVERGEADAAVAEFGDHVDEVLEAAAVAVQARDDEGVAGVEEGVARLQFGAERVLAGLLVREDLPAPGGGERVELPLQFLPAGRDSRVLVMVLRAYPARSVGPIPAGCASRRASRRDTSAPSATSPAFARSAAAVARAVGEVRPLPAERGCTVSPDMRLRSWGDIVTDESSRRHGGGHLPAFERPGRTSGQGTELDSR